MSARSNLDPRDLLAAGRALLEKEAALLDEQRWDEWLALLKPEIEYWMPSWKADETLTTNPQAELSHFYYASRAGLEDRILRIRSGRSAASTPLPRTTHLIGNVLLLTPPAGDAMKLRASWVSHVFLPRSHADHAFHGHSEYTLQRHREEWRIARKKIVLQNDYIPTMLDFYCV